MYFAQPYRWDISIGSRRPSYSFLFCVVSSLNGGTIQTKPRLKTPESRRETPDNPTLRTKLVACLLDERRYFSDPRDDATSAYHIFVWLLHIGDGALALVSSVPASSGVRAVVMLFDSRRCRLCRARIFPFSFSCLQAHLLLHCKAPCLYNKGQGFWYGRWKCRLPWRAVVSGRQIV